MTATPIENPKLFAQQFMIGLKMMKPNLGFQKKDGTIINKDMMLGRQEFHDLGDQLRSTPFYNLAKEAGLTLNTLRVDERLADLREKDPRTTYTHTHFTYIPYIHVVKRTHTQKRIRKYTTTCACTHIHTNIYHPIS